MRRGTILLALCFIAAVALHITPAEAGRKRKRRKVECCQPCEVQCAPAAPKSFYTTFTTVDCPTMLTAVVTNGTDTWESWQCSRCNQQSGTCSAAGTCGHSYKRPVTVVASNCTGCDCSTTTPSCTNQYCVITSGTRITNPACRPAIAKDHAGVNGQSQAVEKLTYTIDEKFTARQSKIVFVKFVNGKRVLRYAEVTFATEKRAAEKAGAKPAQVLAFGYEIAGVVPEGDVALPTTQPDRDAYPFLYTVKFEDKTEIPIPCNIIAVHE